jgi:hypothetical protein
MGQRNPSGQSQGKISAVPGTLLTAWVRLRVDRRWTVDVLTLTGAHPRYQLNPFVIS